MTSRLSWEIDYLKNDLSFCQYQTVKRSFFVLTCADRLLVSLISMFRSEFHDAVFPSVTLQFLSRLIKQIRPLHTILLI